MSMLYYWLAFFLGMVFYAAYLSQSFLLSQGILYMKEKDQSPPLLWLFTRLIGFILRAIPGLLMRPIPLILWVLGMGLTVQYSFAP
ncbi:hypothetical protein ACYB9R_12055 [Alcaligenes aquatilis]|jgi:hypothetical protein|uniref:YggT family protein n=2 Tax=Alcaligenes TaxID=507 RepID=A0AB33CUA0_ALCFA|nr:MULTISPECIES: hypothetical protein [Alcaligenes]ASR88791.1 hypothetical protein AFA_04610 [Alcaligenes faecalis]AWG35460.1 hypothetical protein CA948_10210 [Alcaligenes aquatilis]MCC9164012.1 hypothetical protein [Alcaligenes sp. MMA]MCH4224138.1 hypothetical protein [Alcaligenes faecalis]QXR36898.1 hypothetical protein EGK70_005100 [Alcaligenes aquatilis]